MIRCICAVAAWFLPLTLALAGAGPSDSGHALDVQGHRGCRGLMPENSMPAFRKALELGVTTLELDVHSTADQVLVVHHDAKLNSKRCVDASGSKVRGTALHQLTWEQLQGIDCGRAGTSAFPEQERVAAPIPRLDEVLALAVAAAYPVRVSVEIKASGAKGPSIEEIAGLLVDALRRHDLVQRAIVQSFSAEALVAVHEIEPALTLAILIRDRGSYDRALERSGAGVLSPKAGGLLESDVRRFQERGIAVIPWTVNRPAMIRRMIDWSVDGIVSDYPDQVIEILNETDSGGSDQGK